MNEQTHLLVGQVVTTHGIRGEVRVYPHTDFPEVRFAQGSRLLLIHPDLREPLPLTVEKSRPHKRVVIIKFREWDDINQAEPYKGGKLVVERADAVDLNEGEFYFHEIIGCQVVTTEGRNIGTVREILQLPANDVWVVAPSDGGKDILIPYIDDVVKEVDPESKQVVIQWMEGLA
jgi:16S rRNA processing protein RimM